jgi:chemotaxis signal transduction protein
MTRPPAGMDLARAEAILDARTARLAAGASATPAARRAMPDALIASAGGQRFALPFAMLAQVLPARPLHSLPLRDAAVAGAVHERGEVWIVYALAALTGAPEAGAGSGPILLLRGAGARAALTVNALEGTAAIDEARLFEPGAKSAPAGGGLVRQATPDGLMILDEAALRQRLEQTRRSAS